MEKAKQVVWRLLAASVCMLTISNAARADSLDEQRNRYAQIKQAWDSKQMDTVQALMPTLKDYPLYPYCLLYTSPSPRDRTRSRMPSSA